MRLYTAAAEKGDSSAIVDLINIYSNGPAGLLKAVTAKKRTPMYNLSEIHRRGEGVKADAAQAQYWTRQWFRSPDLP